MVFNQRHREEKKHEKVLLHPPLVLAVQQTAVLMWQAAGNAARAAGRFARRHRRAIVVGGVVGAAACVYHSMKKALKEAEEEHAAMLVQVGDEARRRQCLSRTRAESMAALANFLPALKKRLFLAVDVTGPVRELKALRTGAGSAVARRRESARSTAGGDGTSANAGANGSGDGEPVAVDGSAAAEELRSREVELWEQVKVTALTRLVVSLYAFSALALMLHMQLHILGRLSFEESQELLRRMNPAQGADSSSSSSSGNTSTNNDRECERNNTDPFSGIGVPPPTTTAAALREAPAGHSSPSPGSGGTAGVTLSMEARHALLSSTYEHVLGDGLRALVKDVERAVSRCTRSWQAHTRQEVEFQELVAVIRRVRRDVEGPVGGSGYYADDDGGSGDLRSGGGGGGGGRPSGVRHALLLRYIINPSDGIDGGGASLPTATPPGGGGQAFPRANASAEDAALREGGVNSRVAAGSSFVHGNGSGGAAVGGPQALQGVGEVLDETWDTAESPNFAAALQSCLDAAFGMVYEQLRQKAFCRGTGAGASAGSAQHHTRHVVATAAAAGEVAAAGLRAGSEDERGVQFADPASQPGTGTAVAATGPVAADCVNGGQAAAAAVASVGYGGGVSFVPAAPAVAESEESAQVLATVISQAKLVVSDVLEASSRNEYAHAVASLPAVQDLCFSVFGSGGGHRAAPALAAPRSLPPLGAAATTLPAAAAGSTHSSAAPPHDGLASPVFANGRGAAAVVCAAAARVGGYADGGVEGVLGAGSDGLSPDGGCGGAGGVGGVGGPPDGAMQRAR